MDRRALCPARVDHFRFVECILLVTVINRRS